MTVEPPAEHRPKRPVSANRSAARSRPEADRELLRLRALYGASTDIVIIVEPHGHVIEALGGVEDLLGVEATALHGMHILSLLSPLDYGRIGELQPQVAATPLHNFSFERVRLVHQVTGETVPVECAASNRVDDPAFGGYVLHIRDITDQLRHEAALEAEQTRFALAFKHAPAGMALISIDGRYFEVNQALAQMLGRAVDDIVGRHVTELTIDADLDNQKRVLQENYFNGGPPYMREAAYRHGEGHVVWARVTAAVTRHSDGLPYVLAHFLDVTEQRRSREELEYRSRHDDLTGLANRTQFMCALKQALSAIDDTDRYVGVAFLDLDQFKIINDSLGHSAGDDLLCQIAERLRRVVRPADTVARFAGDEFTILFTNIEHSDAARELAERIGDAIKKPITVSGIETYLTASIGIAMSTFDAGPNTAERLLRDADTAMYRAKEAGRARIEIFDNKSHLHMVRKMRTSSELHNALERGHLTLFYQPLVDLQCMQATGYEALLRWLHPQRGPVLPGEFIELAENSGIIVPIGRFVIETACEQLAVWQSSPATARYKLSANLSVRQLEYDGLVDDFKAIVRNSGVDPTALWLEITESALMRDTASTIETLRALRDIGTHISVDDFGTGYSSLAYLRRFPVEALKIDRSFVDGLGSEREDSTIVHAIIELAHALEIVAIAEGIESDQQLEELRRLGCDEGQGYLFSKPLPVDELAALLAQQSATSSDAVRVRR